MFIDLRDRDIGSYGADAKKAVTEQVCIPPGYYATWSGQFEYMERAIEKMKIVIPVTLLSIFLLLYLNFKRITETLIVMLSVPFALVGGIWLMWWLGYNPVSYTHLDVYKRQVGGFDAQGLVLADEGPARVADHRARQ